MQNNDRIIKDFITGAEVPDIGAEANRQAVEKKLVTQKGYSKSDIHVDVPIAFEVAGEHYASHLDLVVAVRDVAMMVFKCAAGSLGSREREVLSAARVLGPCPVPLAIVSDGFTAIVMDSVSGKYIGEGWDAVPEKKETLSRFSLINRVPSAKKRIEKERLIFRTYDAMNVNRRG